MRKDNEATRLPESLLGSLSRSCDLRPNPLGLEPVDDLDSRKRTTRPSLKPGSRPASNQSSTVDVESARRSASSAAVRRRSLTARPSLREWPSRPPNRVPRGRENRDATNRLGREMPSSDVVRALLERHEHLYDRRVQLASSRIPDDDVRELGRLFEERLSTRLLDALEREVVILALTVPEREEILWALDEPPTSALATLRGARSTSSGLTAGLCSWDGRKPPRRADRHRRPLPLAVVPG